MAELLIKVNVDGAQKVDELKRKIAEVDGASVSSSKSTDLMTSAMGRLGPAIAAVGVAALAKQFIDLADSYSLMQGKLRLVTDSTNQLAETNKALFNIAQDSRISLESTVDLYARLARSTESLGVSQKDLLSVTETINKSFIISGASAQAADAAIIQLGQAFASGTLRGDELNSVLEQSPRLAQSIADGLGVTIGKLRQLGADGKLTSEQVFNAIKKSGEAINDEFGKMPKTVGQSMTQMNNSLTVMIGELDKATGASSAFGSVVSGLGGIFDSASKSLHEFNIEIKRLQDVRKIKSLDDANTALQQIDDQIKSLTTSTDLYDRTSRVFKGSVQIQAELNNLLAARASLNRKVNEMAEKDAKLEEARSSKGPAAIEKTKAQLKAEESAVKKAARLREQQAKQDAADRKSELQGLADLQAQEALDAYKLEQDILDQNTQAIIDAYNEEVKLREDLLDQNNQAIAEEYNKRQEMIRSITELEVQAAGTKFEIIDARIESEKQARLDAGYSVEQAQEEADVKRRIAHRQMSLDLIEGFDVAQNAVKSFEDSLVNAFMTGKFRAQDMFKAIMADLIRMQIRAAITAPLSNAITGFFAGPAPVASANGNAFIGGQVHAFADGGAFTNSVATSPTMAPMALFGEAGPEAIMPLKRTASGELGVIAEVPSKAHDMKIEIINQSGEKVEATQSSTRFDGEQFVISVVLDAVKRNKSGMRDVLTGGR